MTALWQMHDWEVTGRWSLLKWNWNSFNSWNQQLEWSKWMSSCFYYCRQVFQSERKFVPNRRAAEPSPLPAPSPKGTGLFVLKSTRSPRSRLLLTCLMTLALKPGCGFKHVYFETTWALSDCWTGLRVLQVSVVLHQPRRCCWSERWGSRAAVACPLPSLSVPSQVLAGPGLWGWLLGRSSKGWVGTRSAVKWKTESWDCSAWRREGFREI